MEILILAIAAFVLAAYGIWRVRRGGSVDDPDRDRRGLPDDLRDKNYGQEASTQHARPGGRGR